MSLKSPFTTKVEKGGYSAIVFIDGDYVVAEDPVGTIIEENTDAATAIQAALDGLSSGRTWKEKVVCMGNFGISTTINIPSYSILEIDGKFALNNSVDEPVITNKDGASGNTEIEVMGGFIDGNKTGQTGGARADPQSQIIVFHNTSSSNIHSIHIKDAKWEGILPTRGSHDIKIFNVEAEGCGYQGIITEFASHDIIIDRCLTHNNENVGIVATWNCASSGYGDPYNINVVNCISHDNGTYGFSIEGISEPYNVNLHSCISYDNSWRGINIERGKNINILGCICSSNGDNGIGAYIPSGAVLHKLKISDCIVSGNTYEGILLNAVNNQYKIKDVQIIGNHSFENTWHGIYTKYVKNLIISDALSFNNSQQTTDVWSGICFDYDDGISIEGSRCYDDQASKTQSCGIFVGAGSDYVTILGNDLRGNISNALLGYATASHAKIKNNMGFVTENTILSPTFAIDSTGVKTVTIPHGLAITPALEDCYLTVIEDTNVDDWAFDLLKVESVDATNVGAKIHVSTASATGAATAKLALRVGQL